MIYYEWRGLFTDYCTFRERIHVVSWSEKFWRNELLSEQLTVCLAAILNIVIFTHELLSEQLTVCLAAILNIVIFKMAEMVVLYMEFIIKAVLKRSNTYSLRKSDLMEALSKISQFFTKLSNFSKYKGIFLFWPCKMS